jgi:hypothetical protein
MEVMLMASDGMSFDKYIDNPSGGSSVVTNRQMYKSMCKEKYGNVLVRENGVINYTIYKTNDNTDSYYIHFKIPSEVIEKFYYDVVVRLFTVESSKKAEGTLRKYAVQFYSNDPAFVYTFAHSFSKNKLFIEDLKPKMSKTALDTKALVKNPKDDVWYVKSLYFAYLTMEAKNLFSRVVLDSGARKYSVNGLLSQITQADNKIAQRQAAQAKLDDEKRKAKVKESRDREKARINTLGSRAVAHTKSTKTVGTSKNTTMVGRVKTTPRRKVFSSSGR